MPSSPPNVSEAAVQLHGLNLIFQSPNPPLKERFEAIYGHLPPADKSGPTIFIEWTFHHQTMAPQPPAEMSVISQGELVGYYGSNAAVAIRMPKYGLITVDLKRRHLRGVVTNNCLEVYGAFEDVMMISLAPLYRRQGWFPLHAFAALSPGGKVALITGAMGAGKTTTGLSLLSAGWKLLSNDSPLLRLQAEKVQVLAYPGRLSAFDDTLSWFEPLRRFVKDGAKAEVKGRQKRVFRVEEVFADPWATVGVAGGVFFPQITPGLQQSELVEVPPAQALLQLAPQAIEGWDKEAIGQNLQLLGKLVEQVSCYHVKLSPRVAQLPDLIATGMGL